MHSTHMARRVAVILILALCGCGTAPKVQPGRPGIQTEPETTTRGRGDMTGEIRLPMNYHESDYRRLVLAVSFQGMGESVGEISPDIIETVSTRLQTEMARLKRFRVFSLHSRHGVRILENLSEAGEANITVPAGDELPGIDLVLTGSIVMTRELHERLDHSEIIYSVMCDFNCEEVATRTVRFAEKAEGRARRTASYSLSRNRLGGFSQEDEQQAINEAAMKALLVLANKLGNTYPTGGKITGVLGNRMTLNKGFEDGIMQDHQMIVYTKMQGVDLPLGVAEAVPAPFSSNLVVYRWNNEDTYARRLIKKLDTDPNCASELPLYAVSYGVPLPPEWERSYRD